MTNAVVNRVTNTVASSVASSATDGVTKGAIERLSSCTRGGVSHNVATSRVNMAYDKMVSEKRKCDNNYYLDIDRRLDENAHVEQIKDNASGNALPSMCNLRNDVTCGSGNCCNHRYNADTAILGDKNSDKRFCCLDGCCMNRCCNARDRKTSSCDDTLRADHDAILRSKYRQFVSTVDVFGGDKSIYVKLLSEQAKLPFHGTNEAAGLDVFCSEDTLVPGKTSVPVRVPLGIAVHLPPNTYGRLTGRSSTSLRGLFVIEGIIDADYRGQVDAMVHNFSADSVLLKTGERFAQLIITPCIHCNIVQAEQLSSSARGTGGFGSTGPA